jgi:acid phosphatase (class A)
MRSTITAAFTILCCATVPQSAGAQSSATAAAPMAYLQPADFPDPRTYLPALAGKDGRAWKRAVSQARVRSPAVAGQIMCAIGARVDPAPTSAFGRLMQRSAITLSQASEQSKATWNRDRPYIGEKGAVTCDPDANFGTQSPGYPSGHAGIGWMWGLMLSQLAPERTNQLLAWGAELGENRIACRVHYPSDVAAGRMLGAALLARMQGDPAFRADMEAARAEIAAARAGGPAPDCSAD